jgi:formylglycine-generating enzyme required for sulfatase activity
LQGENLKAIIRIYDAGRWQNFGESDLPLAVGVSSEGVIVFGSAAESDPAAWFGLDNHKVFLQPEGGPVSARLNGKKLNESAWLLADDEFHIDNTKFTVKIDTGVVVLSPVPQRKVPVLTPPNTPPAHAGQTKDVSPLPTEQESTKTKLTENEQAHSQPKGHVLTPPNTPPAHTGQTKDVSPLPAEQESTRTKLTENEQAHSQPKVSADTTFARLPGKQVRPRLRNGIIVFFVLLLLCVTFVLIAAPVRVSITPPTETTSLSGFPPPVKIGGRYFALPGSYHVVAHKEGYRKLKESIKVEFGSDSSYTYNLLKLPGLLEVVSQPIIGAEVLVDGSVIGNTPLSSIELEAGSYELSIVAQRYLPNVQLVEIQGMGVRQSIEVSLQPGWGTLQIESEPEGADVWLNGVVVGQTPLKTEPMGGDYKIELRKDGWQPILDNVKIEPGVTLTMPQFALQRVEGILELTSEPSGASVMLNGDFRGYTPISLTIISEEDHQLSLSKSGFMTALRSVRVEPDKAKVVDIQLEPEYGIVFIISQPADAELTVDGDKLKGSASQRLRLTTLPHQIEVSKDGYEPFTTTLTPTVSVSKKLNVQLRSNRQVKDETIKPESKTAEGQVFRRILLSEPVQFQMGASRRESGRRSNETQYQVELTRTFYISEKEVTNAEFQKFRQEHNSGSENGFDLNEMYQPVTSVSWDHAVAYLNWLSQKDGLPPAYEEKGGKMVAIVPITTGYRLPTEAEWAFVARYEGGNRADKKPLKYPWGSNRNPPKKSGNYADSSASSNLPVIIKGYADGYRVAAPVGKFPSNAVGIYDLGGNVSEWCHDYYDVHLGSQAKALRDPTGPDTGEYHVVRGASWRHGSITELRLSYRDYTQKPRKDLGFRIARYAEKQTKK